MNKKSATLLISLIFLLTITNLPIINKLASANNPTLNPEMIYVDDDNTQGPWNGTQNYPYKHISDGVSNATEGDTIYVYSGIYNETLTVNKSIIIEGENKSSTIIDGMYEEIIVHITVDAVNITNFTVRNSGGYKDNAGIKIDSSNNSITNCIFYRTKTSIYLNNAFNNEINNCNFHTNGEGVFLKSSVHNTVKDCQFYHNAIGIHIQDTHQTEIFNSYAHTNGIGFFCNASSGIEIVRCAVCDNNDNQGGIILHGSSHINITNCNICHNGVGVKIRNSSLISIVECNLSFNTHFTIYLRAYSRDVTISNCNITNNFRHGIYMLDNSNCKVVDSNIYGNSIDGVYASKSICNARYNWWGGITGPIFTGFRIIDRIKKYSGEILFFPWHWKSLKNIGSSWKTNDIFTKLEVTDNGNKYIDLQGDDTDSDGVPDWWEEKWGYSPNVWNDHENLDPDNDSLNNIEECFTDQWGSNPRHRDLFLEFDWMESKTPGVTNRPPSDQIELMKWAFEKHNITLHVDDGLLGEGEEIPYMPGFSYDGLRDLYWDYFLHNDLNNPRKEIFHYGLICDYSAGPGFAFIGWDNLNAFTISAQLLANGNPSFTRGQLIMTGSMHETGHTLGLFVDDFGGNDNHATFRPWHIEFWKYSNYKSCMNYRYTWSLLDYSDGDNGSGDFNDWENLDFSFFKDSHFEWPKEAV